MGKLVEELKRNKYLDRERRFKQLSTIILDLNDETLRRLADTGKKREVTTAAMYHLSAAMYHLWAKPRGEQNETR